MASRIAILGFAESYRDAPFSDPTVEIWGLNELWSKLPRWDRWFETHPRDVFAKEGDRNQAAHVTWLQQQSADKPIYMLQRFDDIPGSIPYPLEALSALFFPEQRVGYFTSSIAYMLALAISERPDWIGLYGIDLVSDLEYANQRACAEYFIGVARGAGITVEIASGSALLKAPARYGFDQPVQAAKRPLSTSWLRLRLQELQGKHATALDVVHTLDGAIEETLMHLKFAEMLDRGVQFVDTPSVPS